jgi:hypothetical protein
MIVYSKRRIERVELIIKETKKDKDVAFKWLQRNNYVPCGLPKRPVHRLVMWHARHPRHWARPYPGGFKNSLKTMKGLFLLTAERPLVIKGA